MITEDMLPKWLAEDPAMKGRVLSRYCVQHNLWYWPSQGCSCCVAYREEKLKGSVAV